MMKLKGDKNGLYILGIVAIVAVVGMLIFFTKSLTSSTDVGKAASTETVYDEEWNLVGEAMKLPIKIVKKTSILPVKKDTEAPEVSIFGSWDNVKQLEKLTVEAIDSSRLKVITVTNYESNPINFSTTCPNQAYTSMTRFINNKQTDGKWWDCTESFYPSASSVYTVHGKTFYVEAVDEAGNIGKLTRTFP